MGHRSGVAPRGLLPLGAEPVRWPYAARCCGTFLSVSRPVIAADSVQAIMEGAAAAGAECIVTACAMCHLNLEIRCTLKNPIPTLHFSELLSMALGGDDHKKWFPRHIVDPVPLLKKRQLI